MKEYNFKINGNDYCVSIEKVDDTNAEVMVNGTAYSVEYAGMEKPKVTPPAQVAPIPANQNDAPAAPKPQVAKPAAPAAPAGSPLKSPLPGVILELKVKPGDTITDGQTILVLEAMKMENNIDSDRSGVVKSVNVSRGDSVLEGDVLITFE